LIANVGDLIGNWSWTVWLLVPLALGVALVTALALGPLGEPTLDQRRTGGVTRHLARRGATTDSSKEAS
jgi:hypothetical protein